MSQVQGQFEGCEPAIAVGRYFQGTRQVFLPFSSPELERGRVATMRRLASFHFRTGRNVLVTSLLDEGAQFLPVERAAMQYGLVVCSADASPFDAGRVESALRRFEMEAVIGVSAAVLDGLNMLGHDPGHVFRGPVVWARPDAYAVLKAIDGLDVRLWMEVGPAVAMECSAGRGAHICGLEWHTRIDDGEVVLTSRLRRATEFHDLRTGIRARACEGACACGSHDLRLVPSS